MSINQDLSLNIYFSVLIHLANNNITTVRGERDRDRGRMDGLSTYKTFEFIFEIPWRLHNLYSIFDCHELNVVLIEPDLWYFVDIFLFICDSATGNTLNVLGGFSTVIKLNRLRKLQQLVKLVINLSLCFFGREFKFSLTRYFFFTLFICFVYQVCALIDNTHVIIINFTLIY